MTQLDPLDSQTPQPQTSANAKRNAPRQGVPVWALVVSTIAALALGGGIAYGSIQPELVSAHAETAEVQIQLDDVQSELDGVRYCVSGSSEEIGTNINDMSTEVVQIGDAFNTYSDDEDIFALFASASLATDDYSTAYDAAVTALSDLTNC